MAYFCAGLGDGRSSWSRDRRNRRSLLHFQGLGQIMTPQEEILRYEQLGREMQEMR
jgi:hypothetical protein